MQFNMKLRKPPAVCMREISLNYFTFSTRLSVYNYQQFVNLLCDSAQFELLIVGKSLL